MNPVTVLLTLPPDVVEQLRKQFAPPAVERLTATEIEAIAAACVDRLKAESLAQAASMTVAEFAKQARLSYSHVHALIRSGRLEAVRPGGGDRRITAAAAARYFAGAGNGNAG